MDSPQSNPAQSLAPNEPAKLPENYYAAFGIAPHLALDVETLQRRFYDSSRAFHPDRFARKSPAEQQYALDFTSLLNDAWRTLRDPALRAEYFLGLAGLPVAEQRSKNVPPELLEEVFELNMALEEAKLGDQEARQTVTAALVRFQGLLADLDQQRDALFAAIDAAEGPNRATQLDALRALLNRRKYLLNLIRDASAATQ